MNIRSIILILIFTILSCVSVYADDIDLKISDAEKAIRNAATVEVKYKSEMIIGSDILDAPVQAAIQKKREYEASEEAKRKDLQTDVVVNLSGASKNIKLSLDAGVKDYSSFIDNIIINADGLYYFISPAELSVKQSDANIIRLNIKDKKNIVSKYNGTANVKIFKIILLCLFVLIAVYVLFFMLFYIKKVKFREGFNVKLVYVAGGVIAGLSIMIGIASFIIDGDSLAEKSALDISGKNPVFEVDMGSSSSQAMQGIYLGLPPYSSDFNINVLTAFKQSEDTADNDKVVGGKYIADMKVFKFPIDGSENYYLHNNNIKFDDISENDEGLYEAVSALAAQNIISGKTDSIYGADDTVTRADTLAMLCNMFNLHEKPASDERFEDVKSSDWYYDYVMIGRKYGLLSGYEDNTFRPEEAITRQDFAAALGKIMSDIYGYSIPADASNLAVYEDVGGISVWLQGYISLLEQQKINIWQQQYMPLQPITRGETAMMLFRVYAL